MSVVRARNSRSLAFTVALAVLLALAIPFAGVAMADVRTDNTCDLQVTPETDTNPTGTGHTLTGTITNCGASTSAIVAYEIESGPAARVNCTPGADGTPCPGGTASNDANASPADMSCTATLSGGNGSCSVFFTSDTIGTNSIRGWIDDDEDTATKDADLTEAQDETVGANVGTRPETDDTDVVDKTWFSQQAANVRLDCDDAGTATGDDTETNPPGQSEVYTCRAFNTQGTTGAATTDDTAVSGAVIDGENRGGSNDPDNGTTTPPDYTCTTAADGTCQITVAAGEGEVGTASICFWIDEDNDNDVSDTGAEFDGGECDNETVNNDEGTPLVSTPNNKTDLVEKTWAASTATSLDAEPERDSNVKGTSHTVTATVRDQFGNPSANVPVDFVVTSANSGNNGAGCQNVLTNAQGVATCTYTDSTTVNGPDPETDTINVSVDGSGATDTTVDEVDNDRADRVEKFWFTTLPTPATVILDMNAGGDPILVANCADATTGGATATNQVETNHDVCGVARDSNGAAIAGQNVTLTITGPGNFVNEATTPGDGGTDRADDTALGKTITVTTDANGLYTASLTSLATGITTVTATAGSASDTGTKTWQSLGDARTIDCEPETGTNPPGSEHVVTCTLRDRLGNPMTINFACVDATETGPGRIDRFSGNNDCTDANGQVELILSSTVNESGTQTVVVFNEDDLDDPTPLTRDAAEQQDDCDRLAGDPVVTGSTAAAAGICADEITKTWGDAPAPTVVDHVRTIQITKFKHIKLPGRRGKSLMVKGTVGTPDGFTACHQAVDVKVQINAEGQWITRKSDTTNGDGNFKVLIRDVPAKYRAVATPHQIVDEDANEVHNCLRAEDEGRHRHRGGR